MIATLDYFLPYQLDWIKDPSPMSIGEKSRRIGWTYAESYRAVERRVTGPSSLYFSSADQTASREFIDYCKMWCKVYNIVAAETDEEVIDESSQRAMTTMVLTFQPTKEIPHARKIVAGTSNPNFFRSKGGDADGDEFAFHRDGRELVKAMHATALFWGHQLRLWSTHNGPGSYFNSMIQSARAGKLKARVHRVTILDAVDQGIVEKIKQLKSRDDKARQEWLDELRSTCPDEDTWNEEYLCIPSTDSTSLLSYDLIRPCEANNLQLLDAATLPHQGPPLYFGMDVGRKRDATSFWGLEKLADVFWTRMARIMQGATFSEQEGVANLLLANPRVKRFCIDSTGLGMQLAERLQQRWGKYRVEAVHFTAPVKSEIAMPVRRLFEDKLIRIPADDLVREDLHSIRKIVTAANNVRLDADRSETDGHGDRFWSLALAYHAADDNRRPLPAPQQRKPVGW